MKTIQIFLLLLFCNFSAIAGHYLEYKFTGGHLAGGIMKTWYQDKNTRSEMDVSVKGAPGIKGFATLFINDKPNTIYMLNEVDKTYSEITNDPTKTKTKEEPSEFEFTVIGKEKVNGYNATHVRAKKKNGKSEMDWWLSKEVEGYQDMKDMKMKDLDASLWLKGLKTKGVEGFPVRLVMKGSGKEEITMQMDLMKSQIMSIPASKFSLEGYTKTEGNPMLPGGLDPEKIKNMTTEERQKFMEEMMKKYQKQQ